MDYYRIVYPEGNKQKITVAGMFSWEEQHYAIADEGKFFAPHEGEAWKRCYELSRAFGVEVVNAPSEFKQHTYVSDEHAEAARQKCDLFIKAKFDGGEKLDMEFKDVPGNVLAQIIVLVREARNAAQEMGEDDTHLVA